MPNLKTDFKDDILAESMGGKRRYRIIQNADGTIGLEDVTEYMQMGSMFGALEINETNAAIIALQNEQLETVDPMVTTEPGFAADALKTKEAIQGISAKIYPVGSIYMSVNSTNPSTLFGGTWQQIQGRFLLGAGGGYAAGSTGGEAAHALTVNEMPSHRHATVLEDNILFASNGTSLELAQGNYASRSKANQYSTGTAGRSAAHNNMPPYLTVYIWKRIA